MNVKRIIKNILYVMIAAVAIVNSLVCMKSWNEWAKEGLSMRSSESEPVRQYKLSAAGVLPVIYNDDRNQMIAILGRQTKVDKVNVGKYDYFAGIADREDKDNSVATAAREWWEESRLGIVLGWNLEKTQEFIKKNVKGYTILATHYYMKQKDKRVNEKNAYGVMYLVDVSEIKDKLFSDFESSYQAVESQKSSTGDVTALLEKDKLVSVKYNDLLGWVKPGHDKLKKLAPLKVSGQAQVSEENVELRPILTVLLKGMTKNNAFTEQSDNLPLGVFIFATETETETEKESKEFGPSQLSLGEKKSLNDMAKVLMPNPKIMALAQKIQSIGGQGKGSSKQNVVLTTTQQSVGPQVPPQGSTNISTSQANFPNGQQHPVPQAQAQTQVPVVQTVEQKPSSVGISGFISASFSAIADFFKNIWNYLSFIH